MAKRRGRPRIVIIAGPNGAGKTTVAREFLPREAGLPDFINADLIAQGISPFAPEKAAIAAGRIMLQMIREKVRRRESFAPGVLRDALTNFHGKPVFPFRATRNC